eukprot:SAG31_NODE_9218_length_1314_cov_4.789300_1_plen_85_part_00
MFQRLHLVLRRTIDGQQLLRRRMSRSALQLVLRRTIDGDFLDNLWGVHVHCMCADLPRIPATSEQAAYSTRPARELAMQQSVSP